MTKCEAYKPSQRHLCITDVYDLRADFYKPEKRHFEVHTNTESRLQDPILEDWGQSNVCLFRNFRSSKVKKV